MTKALDYADEALKKGEVPVGCIFVYEDEEIATGGNRVNETKNATSHAEIVAIEKVMNWCAENGHDQREVFRQLFTLVRVTISVYHTTGHRLLFFERSIIEPVRNTGFRDSAHFHLSYATSVDLAERSLQVTSVLRPSLSYTLQYDKLVIGVGAFSNTFGTPGVEENAFFLKEIQDARRIRNRILSNFELALQPGIGDAEISRLLQVVIVGGGPTGVEFGAELYDFIEQDGPKTVHTGF
nr:hypothetical protein BaRGS_015394 [Batillaria attramentaria]